VSLGAVFSLALNVIIVGEPSADATQLHGSIPTGTPPTSKLELMCDHR
jgi:hypothetical protein